MPVQKLRSDIDSLFYKNPQYKLPEKWEDLDDWSKRGLGFLNGKFFYFNSVPEEMYYVTIDSSSINGPRKATMFIRSVNMGYRWFNYADMDDKEKKRIEERFDNEIVLKLNKYTHQIATKESN